MTSREKMRADAMAFARDLRERGLYALSEGLSKAVDGAMFADAEAETRQTAEATATYLDAERRLLYLVGLFQRTLEDIANAPLGRGSRHVRAFGVEFETSQAVVVARKLTEAAYELTREREREQAERLVTAVYGATA